MSSNEQIRIWKKSKRWEDGEEWTAAELADYLGKTKERAIQIISDLRPELASRRVQFQGASVTKYRRKPESILSVPWGCLPSDHSMSLEAAQ